MNIYDLNKGDIKNKHKKTSVQKGSKESQIDLNNKSISDIIKTKNKKLTKTKTIINNRNAQNTTDIKLLLFISKTEKKKTNNKILKKSITM